MMYLYMAIRIPTCKYCLFWTFILKLRNENKAPGFDAFTCMMYKCSMHRYILVVLLVGVFSVINHVDGIQHLL